MSVYEQAIEHEIHWIDYYIEDVSSIDDANEVMVDEMLAQRDATSFQQMATHPGLRQDKQ